MPKPTNAYVELLHGTTPRGKVKRLLTIAPHGVRPDKCQCDPKNGQHSADCPVARYDAGVAETGRIMRATPPNHELVDLNGFAPKPGAIVFLDGCRVTGIRPSR